MITRSKMRRQLYKGGGIADLYPRQKYGLGSKWQDFKDKVIGRTRKLIPNEIADVAVKAAPFVAMIPGYGPATAGIMRGLGRFDQRGSMSDALKQGALTYAGGKLFDTGMRGIGLRDEGARGIGEFFNEGTRGKIGNFFSGNVDKKPPIDPKERKGLGIVQKGVDFIKDKVPLVKKLPDNVAQKLLVGGAIAGASALASYFKGDFRPQEEGESMEEYLAKRKVAVGKQMRTYMDNYFKFDPEYSQLDDAGKNAFVARYNVKDGGRIGYQTGGISMANTLAQNRAINEAQRQAVGGMFEAARSKLPGYRTPVQEYAMSENSILGPLSKQAASTIIEGQDKSQAALDMLNRTSMSPTGTGDTGIMTQAPTTRPTMADVAGPATYDTWNKYPPGTTGYIGPYGDSSRDPATDKYYTYIPERWSTSWKEYPDQRDFSLYDKAGAMDATFNQFAPLLFRGESGYPETTWSERPLSLAQLQEFKKELDQLQNIRGDIPSRYYDKINEAINAATLNQGGRVGQMRGTGPNGLPGIPRQAPDGMEFDMRQNGGFQPLGAKEKKDDVPAMLAKNEFVFTADAVRGAGNGDIELGAQKMYDTMQQLERRVT